MLNDRDKELHLCRDREKNQRFKCEIRLGLREFAEKIINIPRKRLKGCTIALRRNFEAFLHNILQTEGISLSQETPLFFIRHEASLAKE